MTREEIEKAAIARWPEFRGELSSVVDFALACCQKQAEEDAKLAEKFDVYPAKAIRAQGRSKAKP